MSSSADKCTDSNMPITSPTECKQYRDSLVAFGIIVQPFENVLYGNMGNDLLNNQPSGCFEKVSTSISKFIPHFNQSNRFADYNWFLRQYTNPSSGGWVPVNLSIVYNTATLNPNAEQSFRVCNRCTPKPPPPPPPPLCYPPDMACTTQSECCNNCYDCNNAYHPFERPPRCANCTVCQQSSCTISPPTTEEFCLDLCCSVECDFTSDFFIQYWCDRCMNPCKSGIGNEEFYNPLQDWRWCLQPFNTFSAIAQSYSDFLPTCTDAEVWNVDIGRAECDTVPGPWCIGTYRSYLGRLRACRLNDTGGLCEDSEDQPFCVVRSHEPPTAPPPPIPNAFREITAETNYFFGGNGIKLAQSSQGNPITRDYTYNECLELCYGISNCQYIIWTHGITSNSDCESPWTPGQYPYGYATSTWTALCFLYPVYNNIPGEFVNTTVGCKDGSYRHAARRDTPCLSEHGYCASNEECCSVAPLAPCCYSGVCVPWTSEQCHPTAETFEPGYVPVPV